MIDVIIAVMRSAMRHHTMYEREHGRIEYQKHLCSCPHTTSSIFHLSIIFLLKKTAHEKKYHKTLDNKSLWIYIDITMWDSLI